jgi:uncharacterized protein YciU (UPF0263 family)
MSGHGYPPLGESIRSMEEYMDTDDKKEAALNLQYGTGDTPLKVTEYSPYPIIARALVFDYVREHLDPTDTIVPELGFDDVYVVSFTYILNNWKALISTNLPDGMYYEVTFDVSKGTAYIDAYKRFDHKEVAVPARRRR